jgi:subtilisin family serine protease
MSLGRCKLISIFINKKLVFAVVIVSVLIASSMLPVIFAEQADNGTTRLIVGLRSNDLQNLLSVCRNCRTIMSIPEINVVVIEAPRLLINTLKKQNFIIYIEEDKLVKVNEEVQWNIQMIHADQVWSTYNSTYGDAAYGYYSYLHVAVVDTGIDYTHVELSGAVTYCIMSLNNGARFYKGTNLKYCKDYNGHGTHVAGIIAARLNGVGVVGVAPKVKLYAVRVLGADGSGYISDIARGIIEATNGPDGKAGTADDADVISMSLGGPGSSTLYNAIKYAYNYGVVLVAAAGNEGADYPDYPAAYSEVIAVGAIDSNGQVPDWSNRNPDLVAPGVDILSTYPGNYLAYMSGTSMACPHVSGVVALIQSLRLAAGKSKLTPSQTYNVLVYTAIDLGSPGYDSLYGYGLVDALEAVQYALTI